MPTSETPIDKSVLDSIAPAADQGAGLLSVSMTDTPEKIVSAIDAYVAKPPKSWFKKTDNWTDRALPLGSLWGAQMVRSFGWQWASVIFHDYGNSKAVGVVSPDRSLAIYPFHFIFGCLEHKAPVTILLAFNMLRDGKISQFPPSEFQNVMDGVRHIVPR